MPAASVTTTTAMNLVAVMPLRNEAWIVGLSARVALKWCDGLVCLLHASTDGTADIIADVAREQRRRARKEAPRRPSQPSALKKTVDAVIS